MGEKGAIAFKRYICDRYPNLILTTPFLQSSTRKAALQFGSGAPGIYAAQSSEEEQAIERSPAFGVHIVQFTGLAGREAPAEEEPKKRGA